jgi:biopolymer transport protein ExbD
MRVEPLPKKHRAISLTPLVDVIFLLLLFFMLSSTFTQFGQVEIGAPAAAGGSETLPKAILMVERIVYVSMGQSSCKTILQLKSPLSLRSATTAFLFTFKDRAARSGLSQSCRT